MVTSRRHSYWLLLLRSKSGLVKTRKFILNQILYKPWRGFWWWGYDRDRWPVFRHLRPSSRVRRTGNLLKGPGCTVRPMIRLSIDVPLSRYCVTRLSSSRTWDNPCLPLWAVEPPGRRRSSPCPSCIARNPRRTDNSSSSCSDRVPNATQIRRVLNPMDHE